MSDTTKTTVYLNAADYRRLQHLARQQQRSAAELVREAVAAYVTDRSRVTRPSSLGAGRSGRDDLSEKAETLLQGMGSRR